MSRIATKFSVLRQKRRKALIPYITAGDPQPEITVPLMHKMVSAGADIIELGVPFSDPMADGPVIQLACERALAHDVTLTNVLSMVQQFRQDDKVTPIVLMGYLNPIEILGYQDFMSKAEAAGVDGLLVVDMPPEEADEFNACCKQSNIDMVFLLAPTSTDERIAHICSKASGYVYYVSLKGVTGAANFNLQFVQEKLKHINEITDLPIVVGFGINSVESAAQVATIADGVVIGSLLVNIIAEHAKQPANDMSVIIEKVGDQVAAIRAGMDKSN